MKVTNALADLIDSFDEAAGANSGLELTAEQVALITGQTSLLDDLKAIASGGLPATLTIKDVLSDLQIDRSTLWKMRRAGTFCRTCNGPGVRFDRLDYMRWKLGRHAA